MRERGSCVSSSLKRTKVVLVSEQPGAVQDLAVGQFGAVGIVSYAQNQKTAWWGENLDAIRWGHLETFSTNKTFAFMVSLRTAHAFQERLAKGDKIVLHAVVKAGQHPGNYEVVTATIPGEEPKLKEEEIAYSCHLDHQRPGANDNASGYFLAGMNASSLPQLVGAMDTGRQLRIHDAQVRLAALSTRDRGGTAPFLADDVEEKLVNSLTQFAPGKAVADTHALYGVPVVDSALMASKLLRAVPAGEGSLIFKRKREPKGPMVVFGYDYFRRSGQSRDIRRSRSCWSTRDCGAAGKSMHMRC
jgi:hypothetical protein